MKAEFVFKDCNGVDLEVGDIVSYRAIDTIFYYVNDDRQIVVYGGGDGKVHTGQINIDRTGLSLGSYYMSEIVSSSIRFVSRRGEANGQT